MCDELKQGICRQGVEKPWLGLDVASGSMAHDSLFTLPGGTVLLPSMQREAGPTGPKEQWQITIGFLDDNC